MFFLKQVFKIRDKSNPEAEKPFLEHLEDLRICITRIMVTLLVATITCFIFRAELMEVIRRPVEEVWHASQQEALRFKKTGITTEDWETAKVAAEAAAPLEPDQRQLLLDKIAKDNPDLREDVRLVFYYRAALAIEDKGRRKEFVNELPGVEDALRSKLLALLDGMPNAQIDARGKIVLMQALKPTEGFMLSIKLSVYAGLVISFPFLLYFLLQFVLPGMHEAERKALWPAMAVGFGLFLSGVFFAYYIVLPRVLDFFYNYSSEMQIENVWRIGYYISFATQFTLIFGLSFELPVVVMTLVKLGILNSEMMRRTRAYAVLSIFVIAAIITPTPDALTLMLLALPMVVLYEICIWLALFLERKDRKREEEEERERLKRLVERREKGLPDRDGEGGDGSGETESGQAADGETDDPDPARLQDEQAGDHDPYTYEGGEYDPSSDDDPWDDPESTEEGEQEDISDPWPEEDDPDRRDKPGKD